jgi:hypothetical protein
VELVQVLEVHVALAPTVRHGRNQPSATRVQQERATVLGGHRLSNGRVMFGVIAEPLESAYGERKTVGAKGGIGRDPLVVKGVGLRGPRHLRRILRLRSHRRPRPCRSPRR